VARAVPGAIHTGHDPDKPIAVAYVRSSKRSEAVMPTSRSK
jgi:hypothetical protein